MRFFVLTLSRIFFNYLCIHPPRTHLKYDLLIYVLMYISWIAKIASRCADIQHISYWYVHVYLYDILYIHDFQCMFCNEPILNVNFRAFFFVRIDDSLAYCTIFMVKKKHCLVQIIFQNVYVFIRKAIECFEKI